MSNQIEEIQKLYAKEKSYKIPEKPKEGVEQVNIKITPLSVEDMGDLNMKEGMPLSEASENVKTIFAKSLRITKEEAAKISFEFMQDLLSAVMNANNFKEEDLKKTGIKDFLNKKREQIKAQKEEGNAESNKSA